MSNIRSSHSCLLPSTKRGILYFFFLLSIYFITTQSAFATANYVYHERTINNPGCGGQYVSILSPGSADAVTLRFKVEYQNYTNTAAIYYTTDGTNPSGAFGTPSGTTQVLSASWVCIFNAGQNVDVWEAIIPAQQGGKTVKYIISAWHSGGGSEIFANSGEFVDPKTTSAQATQFSYTVTCPTITFDQTTLSNGTVGSLYNHFFTVSGGTPSHTFAVTSGSLPAGLSLTAGGSLDGTPTTAETYNFTVTATDMNGCTGSQAFSITVNYPPLALKSISPSKNSFNISKSTNITVVFNKPMNTGTFVSENIIVGGPLSGRHFGTIMLLGDTGFVFDPNRDFEDAEVVNISLRNQIRSGTGEYLTNGYHTLFTVQAQAGTGGFVLNNLYPMNTGMQGITSGDWDSDGDVDLAAPVNSSSDHRLYIMYNDGTGHFFRQETMYVASSLWRVRSGDLDNDGDLDIVGNCNTNYGTPGESFVYTFLNDGVGNFTLSADRVADVGGTPHDMDLGDLDGDGDLDILVPCYNSNTASVLKNNGSGGFSLYSHFGLIGSGSVGDAAKLYDLDGDGDLDGIIGNYHEPFVRILFNDGQGSFSQDTVGRPGGTCPLVTAGDFNGDGIGEVLTGGTGYNSILTNDGSGNITFGYNLSSGGNKAIITDVEGDGDLDVVPTYSNYEIGVYKNNGAGSFAALNTYGHGGADPFGFTYGDLDGDGDPDLATGNYSSSNVSVVLNEYGCPPIALDPPLSVPNSSENASYSQTFTVTGSVESFSFIISSGTIPPGLSLSSGGVLSGTTTTLGTYTFTVTAVRGNGCSASKTYTIVVGEPPIAVESTSPAKNALNVSVSSDVVIEFNKALNTSTVTSSSMIVEGSYSGRYSGSFSFSGDTTVTFNPSMNFRVGEQVNVRLAKNIKSASGDSLVSGYRFSFTVQAIGGTGSFTHTQNIATGVSSVGGTAADLDMDGDIDLIVGTSPLDSFTVMLNNGAGGFVNYRLAGGAGIFGQERHTIVADFDGDGDPDILAGLNQVYTNAQLVLYYNDGTGHFPTRVFSQMGGIGHNLTVGDWDGDMDMDVAVYSPTYTQPTVVFLKNDGSGNFTETLFITMWWGNYNYDGNIVNFDYDGDGDLDVLCGNGYGSYLGVFVNDGTGNFSSSPMYRGDQPKYIYHADFDNDGDIDLAVLHTVTYRYLEILKNNGYGVFTQTDSITGTSTFSVGGMADVDGDGDIDFTAIDENNRFEVLKNNGTGTFTQTQSFLYGGLDAFIAGQLPVGDFDGDGDMDAATMNYSSPNVSILLNNFTCPTITLSPSSLPNGTKNNSYSQTITASGGTSPYSFAITTGSLPSGITLSSSGVLSGTPANSGTSTFKVTATDVNGCTGSFDYTLAVQSVINIVTGAGTVPHVKEFDGTTQSELKSFFAYDAAFQGGVRVAAGDVNGDGFYDIVTSTGSSSTPNVKVFNGTNGSLLQSFLAYDVAYSSGVYVAAGDVNGDGISDIVTGTDAGGTPQVKVFDGTNQSILYSFFAYDVGFTGGVRVAAGDVNGDGRADIITSPGPGAASNVKVFSGMNGSLLSSFFAFNVAFTGGVFVAAGDVNGDGKSDIIAGADAGSGPQVNVFNGTNQATLYSFFAYDAGFGGGVRVAAGDVNGDGSADIITSPGSSGSPNVKAFSGANGSLLASFFAYDGAYTGGVFVGGPGTKVQPYVCPPITMSPTHLGYGTPYELFDRTITATGGTAPYSYTLTSGSLPTGVSFNDGRVVGNPITVGTYIFDVTATDAFGCTAVSVETLVVNCQTISINPLTLPDGTLGRTYDTYIRANSGGSQYQYYVTSGTQPPGISLVASTGRFHGIPSVEGTYTFTVTAQDGNNNCADSIQYTVTTTCPAITVSPNDLPNGQVGSSYNQTISASGGYITHFFEVTNGALPSGLTLSQTGGLSGTPTSSDTATFTITATDALGCNGSKTYSLVIEPSFSSISGIKFEDGNGNGIKDSTDFGLAGWTIFLDSNNNGVLDEGEVSTVTDSIGNYSFGNLTAGIFRVREVMQSGWTRTSVQAESTAVDVGQSTANVNFGNFRYGTIAGRKWNDLNNNADREESEPLIPNWKMVIYEVNNPTEKDTVSTDSTGWYHVTNLPAGIYHITEVQQSGWIQTFPHTYEQQGYHLVGVSSGLYSEGNDFGNHQVGSISGMKFNDLNSNGTRDEGENGLQGWTIQLYTSVASGAVPILTTTDVDGNYSFDSLTAGDYLLNEQRQAGWNQTFPPGGSYSIPLNAGENLSGKDFGNHFVVSSSISGMKFNDMNGNGAKDEGEPGLQGWSINLQLNIASPPPPVITTTDADGNYSFGNLTVGNYTVSEQQQSGWTQTFPSGGSYTFNIASEQNVTGKDFGNAHFSFISGKKFNDYDGDGVKDAGEPGLMNWIIQTTKDATTKLDTTDANGNYLFRFIEPEAGTWTVSEVVQSGWVQTFPPSGTYSVEVTAGSNSSGKDFGNFKSPKISGMKWRDDNGNGVKDESEPPLSNWVIKVMKDAATKFDTTDANGLYSFSFSTSETGTWTVSEIMQATWTQTFPLSGTHAISVRSALDTMNINFGNAQYGSISGKKYEDVGGDSSTSDDPTLNGWIIQLFNGESLVATDTTSGDGDYQFNNVAPGTYTVLEVLQSGWIQTHPATASHSVTVSSGANVPGKDFANFKLGSISGTKYQDTDGDSTVETGEPALQGWVIQLSKGESFVAEDTSDANGNYSFSGLTAGTYDVSEVQPSEDWYHTIPPTESYSITITSGSVFTEKDFGNVQFGTVSGYKFRDYDSTGTFDQVCEEYLGGQKIVLVGSHTPPETTVTDANGNFTFDPVPADVYTLKEASDSYWRQTKPANGSPYSFQLLSDVDTAGFVFGNFFILDTNKFRTFTITDYNKAAGARQKSGFAKKPTGGNVRDSVHVKRGFDSPTGYMLVGVPQSNPDSQLVYGWYYYKLDALHPYKPNAAKAWLYNPAAVRLVTKPKLPGKPKLPKKPTDYITAFGENVAESEIGNALNYGQAHFISFKTNIAASDLGITPPGYGELIYGCTKNSDFSDSVFVGKTLREISHFYDTVLTLGRLIRNTNDTVYRYPKIYLRLLDSIVVRLNSEFTSTKVDTYSTKPLAVRGAKSLYKASYLHSVPEVAFSLQRDERQSGESESQPLAYRLEQNYPNPFNPVTVISYQLQVTSVVNLKVYNLLGQEIGTLLNNEIHESGIHEIEFDATMLPSGVYFYRLDASGKGDYGINTQFSSIKKMMLLR